MKRFFAILFVLAMLALPASAEGLRSFVVNTESGAMLIDENGNLLTDAGEYDVIDLISNSECPAERRLFMVSQMDLSSGFLDEEEYDDGEYTGSFMEDDWSGDWDEELDDVEEWPVDLEELSDGYEMAVIDDVPVSETDDGGEYGDVLGDDFGVMEEDYMDYGYDYGVALMNARGELLTGFDYVGFTHDVKNGIVEAYTFEGFVTVLDEQGNVITEGMYTSIVSDCSGGFFAVMPDVDPVSGDFSEAASIVHISADGTVSDSGMYTFSYETLPGFSEGYMSVLVCDENAAADSSYEYIFIDTKGQPQFDTSFEYAANFIGGVAEINNSDYQVHLINTSGEYVTGEGYSYFDCLGIEDGMPIIGNLADGGFDLISGDDYSIIKRFTPEEGDFYFGAYYSGDNFIIASSDTREMVLDAEGNVLWSGEMEFDRNLYTGYSYTDSRPERFVITRNTDYGYEAYITDFNLEPCSDGYREIYAVSWMDGNGRYQVLNYDMIEYEYDDVVGLSADFETIVYGVVDHNGNEIVPVEYDYFLNLDHDRYWVGMGDQYKLLDSDGKVIAEFTVE